MGQLNQAGYQASSGDYIMLLNDDVVLRTRGWDRVVLSVFRDHPDNVLLVHVNDRLFQSKLCTFPFLTRQFCELAGGVCPLDYRRYRIDDHIYNVFNLLSVLGHNRIVYLPNVEFEHLNHVTDATGAIAYQPDPEIHRSDTVLFDAALLARKALALRLVEVIDRHRRQQDRLVRGLLLEPIIDSVSLRRPEFVRTVSGAGTLTSEQTRITIGVVSADIRGAHAQSCLQALKAYTSNFDLVVLDNNRGSNFNHPREMNRLLSICRTEFLVLMDDDVIVEPGWVNGLLSGIGPNVGVVTPLHKSVDGALSYAGVVMRPDYSGHHSHAFALRNHAFPIQTLCSAVMLIDMNKCGHLRLDESYSKYFLDIDYGLRVWEAGFRVVCAPDVAVTHIGGGTLDWRSQASSDLVEKQRQHFMRSWIETGRYKALETGPHWQSDAEIRLILDLPGKLSWFLQSVAEPDPSRPLAAAREFFGTLDQYPAIKHFVSEQIWRHAHERSLNFMRLDGRRFAALLGQLEYPILLEEIDDKATCFLWNGSYYAAPRGTSQFDPASATRGDYKSAATLALLKVSVRNGVSASSAIELEAPRPGQLQPILLEEGYKGFNIVGLDRVYGIAQWEGAFDPGRVMQGGYACLLQAESIEAVKRQIDTHHSSVRGWISRGVRRLRRSRYLSRVTAKMAVLVGHRANQRPGAQHNEGRGNSARWVALDPSRLIVDDYRGFTIYRLEYKFFAIPCSAVPFSYELFRSGQYGSCAIGHAVSEVKTIIDRQLADAAIPPRRLLFASASDAIMQQVVRNVALDESDRLLVGTNQAAAIDQKQQIVVGYPNVTDWAADFAAGMPEDAKAALGGERFDTVVLPWAYPDTWRNNRLESSASRIANHIEIVTEAKETRGYHGENIHRLLYNKAYLASMLEVVPFDPSMNVLEVGCSDGMVCDLIGLLGARKVTGIDVMSTVGCCYQGGTATFQAMDATNLRFDNDSFDLIYSIATLEHVPNPSRAIEEMIRTLRVGGYCYIQAAPLYYSPFGHHMFAYFGDYPWVHLRLSKSDVVHHLHRNGKAEHLLKEFAVTPDVYVSEMLNSDHLNGLVLERYDLQSLYRRRDIQVLKYATSFEGKEQLTPSILDEIRNRNPEIKQHHLIEHGFEVVFRRCA